MMNPLQALGSVATNAFNFTGRATRAEYWWFHLIFFVIFALVVYRDYSLALASYNAGTLQVPMTTLWFIVVTFFPTLSVLVRRLHDAGFSARWLLVGFIPLGNIALMIMACLPSENWPNKWGPPYGKERQPGEDIYSDKAHDIPEIFKPGNLYGPTKKEARMAAHELAAIRKAEVSDYYKSRVLNEHAS